MKKYFRFFVIFFVFSCLTPHIASAQVVNVPDPNLAAALREVFGLAPNAPITRQDMQRLIGFEAINRQIRDLTGLEHAPQLRALDLGDNQISDIRPLAGLTQLGALSLAENRIRDVTPLTQMTQLEWLFLWTNQISDIRPLAGLTQLERLSLRDNQVSNLTPLTRLTRLNELRLSDNQIRDLTPLAGLTQLRLLWLADNQISDMSPLAGLTQLEWLNLRGNQINDVSPLAGLARLEELYLIQNQISDVSPLAGLTQLAILNLRTNQIRDVSPLAGLTNLTELYLEGNPIQDTSPLASLTKLRVVDVRITAPPTGPVSRVSIPDPNLAAAVREALRLAPNASITTQDMQRLINLDANNRRITNLTGLEHATQLRELYLHQNQIRDIEPLAGLPELKWLALESNQISDVSPLARLPQLERLTLNSNRVSNLSPLAGLIQLELLILSDNQITNLSPLTGLTRLTVLWLTGNNIRDVSALAKLVNLEVLRLSGNPIQDTSPLASLTKLTDVDVKITAPPSQPQPISEDPTQPSPEPAPQETAETPQDEGTQPTETPAPSTITEGQITFSELMFATSGGLFSQPQWIELFNNGPVGSEPVNLRGLRLVIEARDSETRHRYSTIVFEDLVIKPKWTVLLVTRGNSRNSGYLSEDRVYSLYDHSNVSSLGLHDNAVSPASGFSLKLFAADGTLIDSAGNLDGVKRSKDTPLWELPAGWTEDRMRTSLIRRYEDGTALPGTEAMSWVRAADVELSMELYYGHKADIGTPGYRRGGPLPVALSHFGANRTDAGVIIEWTTASETDNAGFNILRGQTKEGSFVKVNPTLIPGAGTTAERTNYTWVDMTAKSNVAYYYRIEDVSFSGNRRQLTTVRMRGHLSAAGKFAMTWGGLKTRD